MTKAPTRRRFLAPGVVQTSAMDCGPAALKCLLEGFGTSVSYGRLREACQTDVDGTSIDTLEEIALQLGLDAEQVMIPADHLLLPEAGALPALVVVRLPDGATHFVVVWRCLGPFVQTMDPASGRRWQTRRRFLSELYLNKFVVSADAWHAWAGSDEFLEPLRRRINDLGVAEDASEGLVGAALEDSDWRSLAALDAAVRMVAAIVRAGGFKPGYEAGRALKRIFEQARAAGIHASNLLPEPYWSVKPTDAENALSLRGAVLVRVRGKGEKVAPDSPDLAAALAAAPVQPGRNLLELLRADGLLTPLFILAALALAAGGVVLEAVLLRGMLELGQVLTLGAQRITALLALFAFMLGLLLVEMVVTGGVLSMGRRLELRLRLAFLSKIPRLGDRYFSSRPVSDMAERSHSTHSLRLLPDLGRRAVQTVFELLFTAAGIVWLAPSSFLLVLLALIVAVGLPFLLQPLLTERDLRARTHLGALGGFYLDAMLGLVPVRTHGAERVVRREHEALLVEWARASFGLQRAAVAAEGVTAFVGVGLAVGLVFRLLAAGEGAGGLLLLVYWSLQLPLLGQELAVAARQYPARRNVTLRLLEPLGAPEEAEETLSGPSPAASPTTAGKGVAVTMHGVRVLAAGHTVLEDVTLTLRPGEHVAVVGPSGAGKSSLVGLLLGWHRPAAGEVRVDGCALDGARLDALRRETVWVDPAVQLWNRSLTDNLVYGSAEQGDDLREGLIEQADLESVLAKLPNGLHTPLGEGGGLLSGGEGQRVRFGRGLAQADVRLAILDEPFRGLDRDQRRKLLARARAHWHDATLLCITHDVGETQAFERVLVIEAGRIVEDGHPAELVQRPTSRYLALLRAEQELRSGLWSDPAWRRLRLEGGRLHERF